MRVVAMHRTIVDSLHQDQNAGSGAGSNEQAARRTVRFDESGDNWIGATVAGKACAHLDFLFRLLGGLHNHSRSGLCPSLQFLP